MADESLLLLRAQMDTLNRELRDLLQQRARLVVRIGAVKRRQGLPLVDAARERQMLEALLHSPGEGFDRQALQKILGEVFAQSRELVQRPLPPGPMPR